MVYEMETWIVPQQRWGRDPDYEGKVTVRTITPPVQDIHVTDRYIHTQDIHVIDR